MTARPALGVVVVTFNSADVIEENLESLMAGLGEVALDVVVVDNGSTDDTPGLIRAWADGSRPFTAPGDMPFDLPACPKPVQVATDGPCPETAAAHPAITLIETGINGGFAAGVNVGLAHLAAHSTADRFWILNPDGAAAPGAALAFASHDPGPFSLMGGRVIYTHDPDTIQIDGGLVNARTGITGNVHLGESHAASPAPDPAAMQFITGASMVASREFYDAVGPMPEDYFLYYEEVDWAYRRPARLPFAYCPGGVVYHRAGTSIGSPTLERVAAPFSQYFKHRGRLRFVRRHLPGAWVTAMAYTAAKAGQYLLKGHRAEAMALLRGSFDMAPPRAVADRLSPEARRLALAPFDPAPPPAASGENAPAHKARKSRAQRALRLIGSVLDPRAYLHAIKLVNYYNYSHVQPRRKLRRVGPGANISPNAVFSNPERIEIGARLSLGARSTLWAGPANGRIVIGDDVLFGPDVMVTASGYRFNDGSPVTAQAMDEADVVIGNDVWLAARVIVLPGARIGDGAVIGAGAVVIGEIPPFAIAVGAPAKVVGQRTIADRDETAE